TQSHLYTDTQKKNALFTILTWRKYFSHPAVTSSSPTSVERETPSTHRTPREQHHSCENLTPDPIQPTCIPPNYTHTHTQPHTHTHTQTYTTQKHTHTPPHTHTHTHTHRHTHTHTHKQTQKTCTHTA